mmetsp:Transcript_48065/g.116990  ORF Transcript_48065/g.116990 Transcript_48065/m.116990 type:complete len:84 (+) Transcript_48065:42-293(+)
MFELARLRTSLYFYPGYNHDHEVGLFGNSPTCGFGKNSDIGQDQRCTPENYMPIGHASNPAITCYGPCSLMPTYRPGGWGGSD